MSVSNGRSRVVADSKPDVELFKFRWEKSMQLCIPKNELLEELPNDLDERTEALFTTLETPEGKRFVRFGRMFTPSYFEHFNNPSYDKLPDFPESTNPSKDTKDLKARYKGEIENLKIEHKVEIENLKARHKGELKLLKDRNERVKERADLAEKACDRYKSQADAKEKEIEKWQKLYDELTIVLHRCEVESDREHHLRKLAETRAQQQVDKMAQKVVTMRRGMEETRIAEADLAGLFKEICYKVTNCIGALNFYMPDNLKQDMEKLRPILNFDTPETIELNIDLVLIKELLKIVLRGVASEFLAGLAQWSADSSNADASDLVSSNPKSSASMQTLQKIEDEMVGKLFTLRDMSREEQNGKKAMAKSKAEDSAQGELFQSIHTYFKWRADTVRLQSKLNGKCGGFRRDRAEAATELRSNITAKFFRLILQLPDDQESDMVPIFQKEGVSYDDANRHVQKFGKAVRECVLQAMELYTQMRMGQAHYQFEWSRSIPFDPSVMEIRGDQTEALGLSDKAVSRVKLHDLRVVDCIIPCLSKYGDDYGQKYAQKKCVRPAEIIVQGLPRKRKDNGTTSSSAEMNQEPMVSTQPTGQLQKNNPDSTKPTHLNKEEFPGAAPIYEQMHTADAIVLPIQGTKTKAEDAVPAAPEEHENGGPPGAWVHPTTGRGSPNIEGDATALPRSDSGNGVHRQQEGLSESEARLDNPEKAVGKSRGLFAKLIGSN